MDQLLFFLIAIFICLATAIFISAPFWRSRSLLAMSPSTPSLPEDREALLERREALLRELKDLEFDHQTGKIDTEDYRQMRTVTAAAASEVLRKLETGSPPASSTASSAHRSVSIRRVEAEAEAEVLIARARRRGMARKLDEGSLNGASGAPVPAWANGSSSQIPQGWRCAACGRSMGEDDRFCATCGTARPEAQ
jgi:rubrerythrin